MIAKDKEKQAIWAVQNICVVVRNMACDKADHERIAALMSDVKYLLTLFCRQENMTKEFENYIELVTNNDEMKFITRNYEENLVFDRFGIKAPNSDT